MAEEKKVIIDIEIKTQDAINDTVKLKEETAKLKQEQKELKETSGENSEAYVILTAQIKANQTQISANEKQLASMATQQKTELGTLERAAAANAELRIERQKLNLETDEGKKRLKEINAELDKNNEVIKDNADQAKKQALNIGNYSSAIGGLQNKMDSLPTSFSQVTAGFKAIIVQMWAMVANPIGAVIAAIAAAFGLLYMLFKNFDPILDKIEQGLAAVGAAFAVLKDAFVEFLTGSKSLTESFSGLGGAMADAAVQAVKLKEAQQELEDANVALIESGARAKQQYDEL